MIKHTLEQETHELVVKEVQYEDPVEDALNVVVPYAGHQGKDGELLDAFNAEFSLDIEEVEFLHRVFGEWLHHQRGGE